MRKEGGETHNQGKEKRSVVGGMKERWKEGRRKGTRGRRIGIKRTSGNDEREKERE